MQKQRFLLALTIWTWTVAIAVAVLFFFVLRNDLSGVEWLGSPLFGMTLLSVIVTVFYFVARNLPIQPTVTVVIWSLFLFIVTTINMLTLAHLVLGGWEDFLAMPIMGTFQVGLITGGIHFSVKEELRGAVHALLIWTVVLFLLTVTAMIALAFAFFDGWEAWQTYPVLGTGLWTALMIVAYLRLKSLSVSLLDALFYWTWSLFIGIGVSMAGVFFILLNREQLWPFYPIVGTLSAALLVTALKASLQNQQAEVAS